METIVVAGGAGFIGSNFVRCALDRTGARVVVVDALTYAGSLKSLKEVSSDARFTFVHADIADRAAMDAVLAEHQPRWVVNFAAESHVDRSIEGPRTFVHTNIVGAFELLDAAHAHWSQLDKRSQDHFRFLHVSTDEVYGSLGDRGAFLEETAYAPNSPYAASKAGADHLVRAYNKTFGMPVLITNCSNNYGPYQFPEKLIPLTMLNAAEGKQLPIYGDGMNVRDWLYVEDHCDGILLVLERGRPGEKYNIGGQNERTNLDVVNYICAALEEVLPAAQNAALASRGLRDYASLKTFVADRPGHDRRYAIDATKIRQELGWAPRHDFDSGMRETVRWYLQHRDWCAAVQGEAAYDRQRLGLNPAGEDSE
jgi:dTDP-glucose 4,6-dehydratase